MAETFEDINWLLCLIQSRTWIDPAPTIETIYVHFRMDEQYPPIGLSEDYISG